MKRLTVKGQRPSVTVLPWLQTSLALVLLAALSLTACSAPEADEDPAAAESEIVRFPSGIFPSAAPIAYGQTLASVPFKAATQFAAVRFRATRGDRVTGTVDAGAKKSIVYIVRKQGSVYVNVKAGGQGEVTTSNVVSHAIEATGDYYLVFRTVPRVDASFSVTLASNAANQACPDAGQKLSLNELVASVPAGSAPRHEAPRLVVHIERRACTYATGCGPVTAAYDRELPRLYFAVQSYGNQQWRVIDGVLLPNGAYVDRDQVSFAGGTLSGLLTGLGTGVPPLPIRGTAGPTCTSVEEAHIKGGDNGASYTDYRIVKSVVTEPLENFLAGAAVPLPTLPVLDALSDEEALRQFARGSTSLVFDTFLYRNGVAEGFSRSCTPLTSCSAPRIDGSACRRLGYDVRVTKAEVTGRDAYRLSTNFGFVDIADGAGIVTIDRKPVTLRISDNALQFEFPPMQQGVGPQGEVNEFSNATCTFPFSWAGR